MNDIEELFVISNYIILLIKVLPYQNYLSNEESDNIDAADQMNVLSTTTTTAMNLLQSSNKKGIIHSKRYNNQIIAPIPTLNTR